MTNLRELRLFGFGTRDLRSLTKVGHLRLSIAKTYFPLLLPSQLRTLHIDIPFIEIQFKIVCPPQLETFVLECKNINVLNVQLNSTLQNWELRSGHAVAKIPSCDALRMFSLTGSLSDKAYSLWPSLEYLFLECATADDLFEIQALPLLQTMEVRDVFGTIDFAFCYKFEQLTECRVGTLPSLWAVDLASIGKTLANHRCLRRIIVNGHIFAKQNEQ
jgi:hypothetical protein